MFLALGLAIQLLWEFGFRRFSQETLGFRVEESVLSMLQSSLSSCCHSLGVLTAKRAETRCRNPALTLYRPSGEGI